MLVKYQQKEGQKTIDHISLKGEPIMNLTCSCSKINRRPFTRVVKKAVCVSLLPEDTVADNSFTKDSCAAFAGLSRAGEPSFRINPDA
jgi:hypothetical protein